MVHSVNSVLGSIHPDDLGVTLIHEHLIFGFPGWQYDTAAPPYDREETAAICVQKFNEAKKYGLRTIVDATPNDGTRDPELYKMVADRTGVNIICATGFYTEASGASAYYKNRAGLSKDRSKIINEIHESMIKDICQGIGHSGVKAGVIKVGTGKNSITPYEEMILEAAVMAQRDTGAPIITHTEAGTMGPQQAEFLIDKGADVKRLLIGHMCGNANLMYHTEVLNRGPYIAFDRFGFEAAFPDTLRMGAVIGLIGLGYEQKIMLSHDCVIKWLGREFPLPEQALPRVRNWGITHIFENILPALKKANISDEQIHSILVQNPRRLFAGE